MASLVTPANGDLVTAELIAQLTELFGGLRNIPVALTGINDASSYALTLKNAGTGSKGAIIYAADGSTVLFQVDGSGVLASRAGGAAERVLTTGESGTITSTMLASAVGSFGAATAFTATVAQSASVTTSTNVCRYTQIGKWVFATIDLIFSSAGTASNLISVGALPVAARTATNNPTIGSGRYIVSGVGTRHVLTVALNSTTTLLFNAQAATSNFGISPAVTIASGDSMSLQLVYEVV